MTQLVSSVLIAFVGMGAIAYFDGCDPVKSNQISRYDQIMPYLANKVFDGTPAMVGLYISAAYSATLSSLSTGLNSFATVFFKVSNFIQIWFVEFCYRKHFINFIDFVFDNSKNQPK